MMSLRAFMSGFRSLLEAFGGHSYRVPKFCRRIDLLRDVDGAWRRDMDKITYDWDMVSSDLHPVLPMDEW